MELIADGLLIATAMTTGLYCLVLSRRLARLTDAGEGIGPQIAALDQALGRAGEALAETRKGVAELRGSAKAASSQLAREIKRGEEIASRVERGVAAGTATLQRLYEADDRFDTGNGRVGDAIAPGPGDSAPGRPQVALPDGVMGGNGGIASGAVPAGAATDPGNLKVERVVL